MVKVHHFYWPAEWLSRAPGGEYLEGLSLKRTEVTFQEPADVMTGWWFGCHQFGIFPEILGISSSQLTNSYFSEGWLNHQPGNDWYWDWYWVLLYLHTIHTKAFSEKANKSWLLVIFFYISCHIKIYMLSLVISINIPLSIDPFQWQHRWFQIHGFFRCKTILNGMVIWCLMPTDAGN